jgi:hypothetical protein
MLPPAIDVHQLAAQQTPSVGVRRFSTSSHRARSNFSAREDPMGRYFGVIFFAPRILDRESSPGGPEIKHPVDQIDVVRNERNVRAIRQRAAANPPAISMAVE